MSGFNCSSKVGLGENKCAEFGGHEVRQGYKIREGVRFGVVLCYDYDYYFLTTC